ncbi:MAG: hypothetical protein ACI942_002554, partial [Planctomycetota bacterium]
CTEIRSAMISPARMWVAQLTEIPAKKKIKRRPRENLNFIWFRFIIIQKQYNVVKVELVVNFAPNFICTK